MNNSGLSSDKSCAEVVWDGEGQPQSVLFGDKYFCRNNGYSESLYVCCQGNSLKERFSALDSSSAGVFTIIETGFGTGLDFCCVWQLWRECAPRSWQLHFISIELYPLTCEYLVRALDFWPDLSPLKGALAKEYRVFPGGVGEYLFDDKRVKLTLVFQDAAKALRRIKQDGLAGAGADVLFFDGFAPSKNPEMWSESVFDGAADLSFPGTTFSTFTVAGFVRRALSSRGFKVQKIPGFGGKKHVLTGFFCKA